MHQSLEHDLAKKFLAMQAWRPESDSQNSHQKVRHGTIHLWIQCWGVKLRGSLGPPDQPIMPSPWVWGQMRIYLKIKVDGTQVPTPNIDIQSPCAHLSTHYHTHITHLHTHEHIHTIHCLLWFPFLHKPHSCVTSCSLSAHICLTH